MIKKNVMQYFNIPSKLVDFSLSSDSFKVLIYLYTRPPDWKIWNKKVMQDVNISVQKLSKVWKELLDKNIITRERERFKSGAIKGGGFTYKINCICKTNDTDIVENADTVMDADIVGNAFEAEWEEHREYRKKFNNTSHGKKSKAKQNFKTTFNAIKKKFKQEKDESILDAISVVIAGARKEKYTPFLQNILDPATVLDKIEELRE